MLRDYDCVYIVRLTETKLFNVTTSNYKGWGEPKAQPTKTFKEALALLNEWYIPGMKRFYWDAHDSPKQILDDALELQLYLTYDNNG
jgi:hypothetical protein